MEKAIQNYGDYLLKHHIRPSYARMKILQYLVTEKSHPTVDEIYHTLIKRIPTLSKTTVYNTLERFKDAKLVKQINIEENTARFDATVSEHGHFKCRDCGGIYDFIVDFDSMETAGLDGFRTEERNVYFKGVCPKCL
ncbi:MAG: Fur family transcriptional regulator [Clostridia bacterium]|jgi:Fur family peroxide stress response transcriptional regulator